MLRPNGDATPEHLAAGEAFTALKRLVPLLKGAVPLHGKAFHALAPEALRLRRHLEVGEIVGEALAAARTLGSRPNNIVGSSLLCFIKGHSVDLHLPQDVRRGEAAPAARPA